MLRFCLSPPFLVSRGAGSLSARAKRQRRSPRRRRHSGLRWRNRRSVQSNRRIGWFSSEPGRRAHITMLAAGGGRARTPPCEDNARTDLKNQEGGYPLPSILADGAIAASRVSAYAMRRQKGWIRTTTSRPTRPTSISIVMAGQMAHSNNIPPMLRAALRVRKNHCNGLVLLSQCFRILRFLIAVGAHPESFSGRAHARWTSWTQADPDPTCFRSCIVDTQHRRAVAHAAAKLSELQIRSSALSNLVPR